MRVLGIETSCDETAAAVVDGGRRILANVVHSQLDEHAPYLGIVPEIAARAHVQMVDGIVARAMAEAGLDFADLDGIAATAGPGLIGGVLVGLMTGKGLAAATGKPLIAVNHLEGHALTARLTDGIDFPYLLLLVSGGHCQLLAVGGVGDYRRLGTTLDDAVGEAFDKTAKVIGLGYPGGPKVERLAAEGDPTKVPLPRPMVGRPGCDFSFAGLKTAVRLAWESRPAPADVCAAFQAAAGDILCDRVANAFAMTPGLNTLVVAGGVAANTALRVRLAELAQAHGRRLVVPPPKLCTDNAAMIAWAGVERLRLGRTDPLDVAGRARWPLDPAA
jgi:N6-L-threonylcarbamoyladenine synthase